MRFMVVLLTWGSCGLDDGRLAVPGVLRVMGVSLSFCRSEE